VDINLSFAQSKTNKINIINMPEWLSKLMGNSVSLEEELINLRLTSKQMQRASKKCDKNEKEAVKKLKKVCLSS